MDKVSNLIGEDFNASGERLTSEAGPRSSPGESQYHLMIDEIEDYAILMLDRDGRIENWNKGAEKIKGYRASEIIGQNFRLFYTPEDRLAKLPEKLIGEAIQNGRARHEGWRLKKDGSVFWGNIVLTAIHNKQGELIGFSKVTRDLTERKMAENALLEKSLLLEENNKMLEKANERLSSFVYISSHDLQEPLRKIRTFISYIMGSDLEGVSEKGRDYFRRIQATAARMQELVQDLLIYSHANMEKLRPATTDLNDVLQFALEELKETVEQKSAIIRSSSLPAIPVVSFQFQQLFINLLGNSLKYSKQGRPPEIDIEATIVPGSHIAGEEAEPGKKYHSISFRDNGIGFHPENNKTIFEIFKRLHRKGEYGGTGIGLAICQKIVDNHEGYITAAGEPGKGAVVTVYIPVKGQ